MPNQIHEVTFKGKTFRYSDGVANPISCNNEILSDEKEIREAYWDIGENDLVLDIGAGFGSYTLPALAHGARVVAFEPIDIVMNELEANVALNGWGDSFIPVRAVLSDEDTGPLPFSGSIVVPGAQEVFNNTIRARLDTIFPYDGKGVWFETPGLTWVKIDVEGAELKVVQGGVETLKKFMPNLVIEIHLGVHHLHGYVVQEKIPERLRALLEGLGYEVHVVPYNTRAYYICGRKE